MGYMFSYKSNITFIVILNFECWCLYFTFDYKYNHWPCLNFKNYSAVSCETLYFLNVKSYPRNSFISFTLMLNMCLLHPYCWSLNVDKVINRMLLIEKVWSQDYYDILCFVRKQHMTKSFGILIAAKVGKLAVLLFI